MGQIITHACGHEQIHYLSGLLIGSDRQIAWATTLRASRLCALLANPATEGNEHQMCAHVTDAKWWIDHRTLTDTQLLAEAELCVVGIDKSASGDIDTGLPQAA